MAEAGTGLSGIPIIGPILDFISGLLTGANAVGQLANAVGQLERPVWTNILGLASWVYGIAGGIIDAIKKFFDKIWEFLKEFWRHLLGILTTVWNIVSNIVDQLRRLAKKIGDIIKRVREWYRKHILKWQLLALNVVSIIRVFLAALRLLHVKWAAKLDADLQKIQGYITLSIVDVVKALNTVQNVLGLAIDPLMILRPDFFAATLFGGLSALKAAAGYGSARPVLPDEKAQEKTMSHAAYGTQPLQTVGPDGSLVYDPALALVDQSITQQAQTTGVMLN